MLNSALKKDLSFAGIIASIYALRVFGFMVILPVLSLHAEQYQHATPFWIGCAIGAYGLTQALCQLPLGALSDRIGRAPVVFIGLALLILGSLLAWYATDMRTLAVARALQGTGAIGSTLSAWCADLTSLAHRTKCMALIGVGVGLSFLLSTILSPWLSSHLGISGLFLLTAFLALVACGLSIGLPRIQTNSKKIASVNTLFHLTQQPTLSRLFFGMMSLHAVYTACFLFIPPMLAHALSWPAQALWQIYLPCLLLAVSLSFPWIAYAERHKK